MREVVRKTMLGWQVIRVNADGAVHVDPDGYPKFELNVWIEKFWGGEFDQFLKPTPIRMLLAKSAPVR